MHVTANLGVINNIVYGFGVPFQVATDYRVPIMNWGTHYSLSLFCCSVFTLSTIEAIAL